MKTILEIGREYHCWTVLRFDRVDERRRRRYWCQCQCGAEKSLAASAVAAGRTKQCTKCKRSKLKGRHFYQWEVLEPLGVDAHHHTIWLCRCQCGKECTVSGGNLIKGASRCCFDCGHKKKMQTKVIPEVWWYKTIRQAEARDISWEISEEQALALFEKQGGRCQISGLPLSFSKPQTASLDRIDSRKGYTPTNIHWVHKHINMMKYKFGLDYFIDLCCKVAANRLESRPVIE